MLAYFVVFYKKGFSPSDLRTAQKNGSKLNPLDLAISFTNSILDYFKNDSQVFINHKGQSITGPQQVEAFRQAQSIGTCCRHG
jgi:sodium/potassium-transporting ATPase subunit alpha